MCRIEINVNMIRKKYYRKLNKHEINEDPFSAVSNKTEIKLEDID